MRRAYVGSWAFLVALGLLAGCSDSEDVSCGEGTELQGGICVATDDDSSDAGTMPNCGDGTLEVDGECVPLAGIGGACTTGSECASGACLKEKDGAPGGYCTQLSCGPSKPCDGGSHCMYTSAKDANLCLATCDGASSCREGYVCQPLYTTDHEVCIPDCRMSDLCSSSTECDDSDGICKPIGCEPGGEPGAQDACDGERLCAPNRLGIGDSPGLCLPECSADKACAGADVCQPITDDPEGPGVCVTATCETDAECPAGAQCASHVCMPPNRCDDEGACEEENTVCVGGPGGKCMPACPDEDGASCSDLHAGLACAETLGACLPLGEFPGSPCRPDNNDACGAVTTSAGDADLTCIEDQCLVTCADSAEVCSALSDVLVCAEDILEEDVCLPKGTFPGAPCAEDDACEALALDSGNAPMACVRDTCTVSCTAGADGDKFCAAIESGLVCAAGVGPADTDVCLPRGSFPGGPCAPGDECGDGMFCSPDSMCLTDCSTGGDTLCSAVRADLFCASDVFETDACLPKGSFPGAPCDSEGACEDVVVPSGNVPVACVQDRCLITCTASAEGNGFCSTFDAALTCVQLNEVVAACVPKGTFPGGPCADDNTCSGDPELVCYGTSCAFSCESEATCTAIGNQIGTTFGGCSDPASLGPDICTPPTD